jgi:hypothetical protein
VSEDKKELLAFVVAMLWTWIWQHIIGMPVHCRP